MKKALKVFGFIAIAAFAACNTITQPLTQNPGDFSADFSGTDGSATFFDATNAKAYLTGSMYMVTATQIKTTGTATLSVAGIPSSATVPYSISSAQSSTLKVSYHDASNGKDYYSYLGGGSCSITISQTSPTLQGTFTARLIGTGSDSVREVTSASFNASIQ